MLAKPIHMLNIVIFNKTRANETREVCFVQNEISIGRKDPDNPDFQPGLNLEDMRVSRKHALIRKVGNKYYIQDLNSKHNTIIDGKSIGGCGEVEFAPCACVQTGDTIWTIVPHDWLFVQYADVIICACCLTEISYAIFHCGTSVVGPVTARNFGSCMSVPLHLELQMQGYSDSCRIDIPALGAYDRIVMESPAIRLRGETLKNQMEPVHTRLDAKIAGQAVTISAKDITILGFWDWPYNEAAQKAIAAFVSPRNPVVESIVLKTQAQLKDIVKFETFRDLLRTGRDDSEQIVLQMLYKYLGENCYIYYANPELRVDPSCQKNYQTIKPPHSIFSSDSSSHLCKATCLDLALLMAGCVENVGLCPLVILIDNEEGVPVHAIAGCWITSMSSGRPIIYDKELLGRCVSSGDLLVVECTGFAQGASNDQQKLNFAQAVESAIQQLNSAERLCAVDIAALRPPIGFVTPMDFPFELVIDGAIEEARQFARHKRRELIEITYLLYGLLIKNGEVVKWLFGKAGLDATTISQKIEEYVLERNASTEPIPTRHFGECKRLAEDFAWQLGSRYVREQDMLWAIFVVGRDSEVFQDAVKKLKVNVAELEELLAQQYPRPNISFYGSSVFYGNRD